MEHVCGPGRALQGGKGTDTLHIKGLMSCVFTKASTGPGSRGMSCRHTQCREGRPLPCAGCAFLRGSAVKCPSTLGWRQSPLCCDCALPLVSPTFHYQRGTPRGTTLEGLGLCWEWRSCPVLPTPRTLRHVTHAFPVFYMSDPASWT